MKYKLRIQKIDDRKFEVFLERRGEQTKYSVIVEDEYYCKLTECNITKSELLRKSFNCILEKGIDEELGFSFSLNDIAKYDAGYESEIIQ